MADVAAKKPAPAAPASEDKQSAVPPEEKALRDAARAAHPHRQLRALVQQMRDPTMLDVNARLAMLSNVVNRLIVIIMANTPEPTDEETTDG